MFWVTSGVELAPALEGRRWPGGRRSARLPTPGEASRACHACRRDLGVGHVVLDRRLLLGLGVLGPHAVGTPEVGDAAVGRDAGAGEDDDALGRRLVDPLPHPLDGVVQVGHRLHASGNGWARDLSLGCS